MNKVSGIWHAVQCNQTRLHLFSDICVTPAFWWLILYVLSFSIFHVGTKRLPGDIIFKARTFIFPPLTSPHLTSPHLIFPFSAISQKIPTSLLLQLLVGDTTQGRLVSSSPRGGQATTKTPWVVSGSLRLSRVAPSRLVLTGLCDIKTHPHTKAGEKLR